MSLPSLRFVASCVLLLVGCSSLRAQTRSYRLELTNGTSGLIVLVNVSDKPIAAFHFADQCGAGSSSFTRDVLDSPSGQELAQTLGPDGYPTLRAPQTGHLVAPHARGITMDRVIPQPSGCAWRGDIDAVLFADGTFEGDEQTARALQIRRDGIAAALSEWGNRLESTNASPAGLDLLLDRAKQAEAREHRDAFFNCHPAELRCAYWSGRNQVDANILLNANGPTPQEKYHRLQADSQQWLSRLNRDEALRELDRTFPLPADLAEAGRKQDRVLDKAP